MTRGIINRFFKCYREKDLITSNPAKVHEDFMDPCKTEEIAAIQQLMLVHWTFKMAASARSHAK